MIGNPHTFHVTCTFYCRYCMFLFHNLAGLVCRTCFFYSFYMHFTHGYDYFFCITSSALLGLVLEYLLTLLPCFPCWFARIPVFFHCYTCRCKNVFFFLTFSSFLVWKALFIFLHFSSLLVCKTLSYFLHFRLCWFTRFFEIFSSLLVCKALFYIFIQFSPWCFERPFIIFLHFNPYWFARPCLIFYISSLLVCKSLFSFLRFHSCQLATTCFSCLHFYPCCFETVCFHPYVVIIVGLQHFLFLDVCRTFKKFLLIFNINAQWDKSIGRFYFC
jgi:hypothetical protein